jgi:hypothetical protein
MAPLEIILLTVFVHPSSDFFAESTLENAWHFEQRSIANDLPSKAVIGSGSSNEGFSAAGEGCTCVSEVSLDGKGATVGVSMAAGMAGFVSVAVGDDDKPPPH